jgi:hypothetical protein
MHVNADELGCLFEVDFASFWAHVEEERPNMVLDERTKELAQADVLQGEV